ncbi:MAG: alpha/beta hydrolase [Pseudomonadales bacterium]|jgi:pimeloyl-ACP methyl ester carboxylesterase|nr:alpha/beta hydrolase [Pseudomonadales bacterium]MDP6470327.1 alpha/beta hydrolase [Pseudomonadales bacterium]MDP6827233.1 alpha/beta hydrolase [Pseudomonadales bacterium]MDP6972464.1 alpha/beta hydrolase [Pseudomonadales bacterium]
MRFEVDGETVFAATGSGSHDTDAPWVVFVHGAGFDHSIWVMPTRYFARHGLNVLALDLPGHGRSMGAPLQSIVEMADWLGRVLDSLGVRETAVVGHSMGSLVAYQFAATQPMRCRSLALLGTSAPMPVTDLLLDAARDGDHAAIDMANTWSHSRRGKLGANENPGVWMMGVGERLLEAASVEAFYWDLAACDGFDASRLDTVSCSALVITGEADQMTPAHAGLEVAETLDQARIVGLAGCGHSMLSEQPNAVLDALIELLCEPHAA